MLNSVFLKTGSNSGAITKALRWLQQQINEGIWQEGDQLPTLDILASQAGVARYTMWKAVQILADQRVITTYRGSGIVLGSNAQSVAPRTGGYRATERLIIEAIYNGEFSPGSALPPMVKLQHRFSVCYNTLAKALASVVDRRILIHAGTRYVVRDRQAKGAMLEVVHISEGAIDNERIAAAISAAEQVTSKMHLQLVRFENSFSEPPKIIELHRIASRDTVSGFVIECWGVEDANRIQNFVTLLSALYAYKKSISIIDELGNLVLPEPFRSSKRVHVFSIAARIAGEEIGRYLLHCGHRRVAFITLTENQSWSQQRHTGIKRAFREAGLPASSITLCKGQPFPDMATLVCAAANLSTKETTKLFPEMKQVQLEPFQSAIEQTIPIIQQKPTDEKTRRQVMAIISLFRDAGDDVLVRELRFDLFKRTGGLLQIRILEPMFDELTKDTTITAWVAATDGTALAACAFLRNRKIDVPAQISVCGFDNRLEATTGRLTSYDFDTAGIFNQAISFAAGRSDVRSDHQTFVEWPGFLVVRHSTGKAKKV